MNFINNLPIKWFDVVVAAVLVFGVIRGRKNGMSGEVLSVVQWVAIIFGGALLYEPLGQTLSEISKAGPLIGYIAAYLGIAIGVHLIFSALKRLVGGKLIGSDIFGSGEYYLGMVAGMVRSACVLLAVLAILNARQFTREEIEQDINFQKNEYGSNFFPKFYTVQQQVFQTSAIGPLIRDHLGLLLIKPTRPGGSKIQRRELELP